MAQQGCICIPSGKGREAIRHFVGVCLHAQNGKWAIDLHFQIIGRLLL
jgi:hypothetical protein